MISLQNLILRRGQKVLIEDANLTIFAKQKIGVIGDNGSGKSSLFALLQGDLEPYQGDLSMPAQVDIAHVKQEIPTSTQAAIEYVIDGDYRYRALEKILQQAEEEGNGDLLANCHDELANMDGYAIEGKAERILKGLGFHGHQLRLATIEFSGGWRMRLNLAQALMSRANLMLLDEPTNHLDLDAIIWLEKWLQDYDGTLLVISHDREFLDNTVTHILHFNAQQLQLYQGNFSSFEKQQAQQLSVQQATYEKQQVQIAHMQSFIDRFKAKASKARQAQSRMKALEKIELVSSVTLRRQFSFTFKQPKECPNPLLRISKANIGYLPDNPVLKQVDLQIAPADRIGLLGVNGAGKSTLVKAIAGLLRPLTGEIQHYKGISIGYFAQHQIEHLELDLSPLEMLQNKAPGKKEQELRTFLGSFNFTGTMATQKIHHFSGGEKARLALALIVWQAPNLLLLDEPTNHLDMNMREALVLALQDYTGALILVSHDRHLIRTTTDDLMIISEQQVRNFTGDLDDYRDILLQKNNQGTLNRKEKSLNTGKEKRKLANQLNLLERELQHLQEKKEKLERLLAGHSLYEQHSTEMIRGYHKEQKDIVTQIEQLEIQWLDVVAQLEKP